MSAPPPRRRHLLRRLLAYFFLLAISLFALGALLLAIPASRAFILTRAANLWIVQDTIVKADAVIVLGGGLQYRTFEAIRFYREGLAQEILIPDSRTNPTDDLGLTTPEKELMRQLFVNQGVPPEKIHFVGTNTSTTYEDFTGALVWARANHAKELAMPTDIFHTRRLRWVAHRVVRPGDPDIRVTGITPREYSASNWWQHEEGLIAFQNEVVKYGMYRVKY